MIFNYSYSQELTVR